MGKTHRAEPREDGRTRQLQRKPMASARPKVRPIHGALNVKWTVAEFIENFDDVDPFHACRRIPLHMVQVHLRIEGLA